MKQIIACFLFIILIGGAFGQKNVGIGTTTPNKSAIVDIESLEKGLLIPRMKTKDRLSINSPAQGLVVYDNEINKFCYYEGEGNGVNDASKWLVLVPVVASGTVVVNNVLPTQELYNVNISTPVVASPETKYFVSAVVVDNSDSDISIKYGRVIDSSTVRFRIKSNVGFPVNVQVNYIIYKIN